MVKGLLLLFATSVLEARIIASFLEAADYEVVDYSTIASSHPHSAPLYFDAAVLVLENGDANLIEKSALLRQAVHQDQLPIVAVTNQSPSQTVDSLRVLLRPIRLFDLVHSIDLAVEDSRRDRSPESQNLHNQHV